ncbi:MAG: hypothetical protein IT463_09930 [Planctomycetes bacterium]|nr:hypothetical protein [Planctomycetota bacterium]
MRLGLRVPATVLALVALAACGASGNAAGAPAPNGAPAPVANSPGEQPAPDKPGPAPQPVPTPIQREADYVSFEGGLRVYPRLHRAEMPVTLLGAQTRALEFLVVSPGGATHESLFATGVKAEHLKRALQILLLKEAVTKRSGRGYLEKPEGDRVRVSVRFQHAATGATTTVPVEDWLVDAVDNTSPEKVGFVFTGSYEQYQPDLNRSLIEADMKGNLIAMWRDASCLLDNDRKHGAQPDVYSPNPKADGIPPGMTEVTLLFEPWKE